MTRAQAEVFVLTGSSLAELEAVVEVNLDAFFEIGRALMEIRDRELYREAGFDGFVEYLESKPWGIGRSRAYQLIDSHRVSTVVEIGNERQARELVPLLRKSTPTAVRQVYDEAVGEAESPEKVAAVIRLKVQETLHPAKATVSRPDYNGRIDEEVIPAAKAIAGTKVEDADWTVFAGSTLRKHVAMLEKARDALDSLISQAKTHVGHTPTK